ncbi:tRNA 4-thiouridine(8) synthase ThiI [Candidatus Poribacteria bacterium]|nr:tRNA 4-thiouridine(8) synthase ThiI [Candidatus Poribacteria bacterium]
MRTKVFIVHYSEIGLKGKNRAFFEKSLIDNLRKALWGMEYAYVRRISGRLLVELKKSSDVDEIQQRLSKVFGISHYTLAYASQQDITKLQSDALSLVQGCDFHTFKVDTRRSQKNFPLTSPEINAQVGGYIVEHTGAGVDLENPALTCFIEIVEKYAFIYLNKNRGLGGLPVGVSGRVAVLLSGGIDSPVASWLMMKRGAAVVFVHFYSYPYTDIASLEKVKALVELLTVHQYNSRLYLVPFIDIQKEIVANTPPDLRVVLYRRMMVRLAEILAHKENAQALVTGESLGQVASQTLANIRVIDESAQLPILRPLIGQDKSEIIEQAQRIGTYETSVLPYNDCCALFVPKHPVTNASLDIVKSAEKNLDINTLVAKAISQVEVQEFTSPYTAR